MTDFAHNLKRLRAQENVSQEGLAAALDVSKGSVQGWERGDYLPAAETLVRLGRLFPDWSLDYMLGLTSVKAPNRPDAEQTAARAAASQHPISRRKYRPPRSGSPRASQGDPR